VFLVLSSAVVGTKIWLKIVKMADVTAPSKKGEEEVNIARKRAASATTRVLAYVSVYEPSPEPPLIAAIVTLEKNPGVAELRDELLQRLMTMPRFRSRLDFSGKKVRFEECEIDQKYHFEVFGEGRKVTEDEVFEIVSKVKQNSLDHTKPLWKMIHVPEMEDGTSKVILIISHVVGDGVGLVHALLFRLIDESKELADQHDKSIAVSKRNNKPKISRATRLKMAVLGTFEGNTSSLWAQDRKNPLKLVGLPSKTKYAASASTKIDLNKLKEVCRAIGNGVTINDVLMAAYTKSLGMYFRDVQHESVKKIRRRKMRSQLPVNLRKNGVLFNETGDPGNKFAMAIFHVPLSKFEQTKGLVLEVKRRIDELKVSPAVPITEKVAQRLLPILTKDMIFQTTYNLMNLSTCIVSNVPGPQTVCHLAGAKITEFQFFLFTMCGIYVGMFSYNGQVSITVTMDGKVGDNPKELIDLLPPAFDEIYNDVCGNKELQVPVAESAE
jgi:hypothetical protein